ncbi:uncharacterized protein LOC121878640 [Homarus americanus]|uniref:uncharacterized protein LOC121878640 n=1 Tax=Homarus americanus TaxID=6706 RepID=UPI001C488A71|nr:uncharacterized protein LOC121878640 [Homarus americanus]
MDKQNWFKENWAYVSTVVCGLVIIVLLAYLIYCYCRFIKVNTAPKRSNQMSRRSKKRKKGVTPSSLSVSAASLSVSAASSPKPLPPPRLQTLPKQDRRNTSTFKQMTCNVKSDQNHLVYKYDQFANPSNEISYNLPSQIVPAAPEHNYIEPDDPYDYLDAITPHHPAFQLPLKSESSYLRQNYHSQPQKSSPFNSLPKATSRLPTYKTDDLRSPRPRFPISKPKHSLPFAPSVSNRDPRLSPKRHLVSKNNTFSSSPCLPVPPSPPKEFQSATFALPLTPDYTRQESMQEATVELALPSESAILRFAKQNRVMRPVTMALMEVDKRFRLKLKLMVEDDNEVGETDYEH